jgi:hypothetical protein
MQGCTCSKYDYCFHRTIDDNGRIGLAGGTIKAGLTGLTYGITHWFPGTDNRCVCGHLKSLH